MQLRVFFGGKALTQRHHAQKHSVKERKHVSSHYTPQGQDNHNPPLLQLSQVLAVVQRPPKHTCVRPTSSYNANDIVMGNNDYGPLQTKKRICNM